MLEAKVIRLERPKDVETPLEKHYKEQHAQKVERITTKVDEDIEYYNAKLDQFVAETLQSIHSDHLPDDIKIILFEGDMKWRTFCANARKFNKYVKLDVDAFEKQMNTIVFKSGEIAAAKEKFVSNVQNANRNFFTRARYRIKSFFQSLKF